MRQRKLKKKT